MNNKNFVFLLLAALLIFPVMVFAEGPEEEGSDRETIWETTPFRYWFQKATDKDNMVYQLNGAENDSKNIKLMKYKDWYHVRFDLQPEDNIVIIKNNGTIVFEADIYYAPSWQSEIIPDGAVKKHFHSKNKEEACSPCHRMKPQASDYDEKEVNKQICYPCHHQNFDNLKSRHKPASNEWRCLQCHRTQEMEIDDENEDGNLYKYTIEGADAVAPLCYKCHKKFEDFIKKNEYHHGPIGMDGCNMCHDPHGSQFKYNTLTSPTTLCVDCHEAQEMLELPNVHQAITQKGCAICHDPHASHYPMQLKDKINPLCYSCHPKIFKQKDNHPVQRHPVYAKKNPKDPDSEFTCVSCHNPHSSEFDKLLPEEDMMMLCANCHSL